MGKRAKIVLFGVSVVLCAGGLALCIPVVQNFLLLIGGKVIGRPLNNVSFWVSYMLNFGMLFICAGLLAVWMYLRTTKKYQRIYNASKARNDLIASASLFAFFFLLFMLPFIIFGEDSVITIHDNLDDSIPRFHYIYRHHLFWDFDTKLPVLDGLSTLFFNREGFSVYNAIYCLLPTYVGYIVNHAACIILGFLSMFYMQRIIFKNDNRIILTLTSLAYALLPSLSVYKMGVATLPFSFILFYKMLSTQEKKWLMLAFMYPFFSELSAVGIFVCGFWLLAAIVFSLRQKRICWRLFLGLLLIGIAFCITNFRLIYMRFFVQEPLNRGFFTLDPSPFIKSFIAFFLSGHYHAATLQNRLLNWVVFAASGIMLYKAIVGRYKEKNIYRVVLTACLSLGFFCALIASLSDARIMDKIIAVVLPPLEGISFTRIYMVARVSWYISFTASLLYIASNNKLVGLSYALGFLQLIVIFIGNPIPLNPFYADSEPTWRKNIAGSDDITWREFYSERQFAEVKNSIGYSGENVCAVGYHPGVLLYNDFNAIDGYISVFPYEQQLRWHNLMKPEFNRNPEDRYYFDSWGGRRYIYNKDLRFYPTRKKYHDAVDLYIDMGILREVYKCKYILSRAELSNAEELGLEHKGTFDSPESIYVIWVYEVDTEKQFP